MLIKDLSERRNTFGINSQSGITDEVRTSRSFPIAVTALLWLVSVIMIVFSGSSGLMLILGLLMSIFGAASLILLFESRKRRRSDDILGA